MARGSFDVRQEIFHEKKARDAKWRVGLRQLVNTFAERLAPRRPFSFPASGRARNNVVCLPPPAGRGRGEGDRISPHLFCIGDRIYFQSFPPRPTKMGDVTEAQGQIATLLEKAGWNVCRVMDRTYTLLAVLRRVISHHGDTE